MIDIYKLIEACEACGAETSRLQIIAFALEHTNPVTGIFKKSYDEISRATGICYSTVMRTMKKLKDQQLIDRIGDGEWKWSRGMFDMGPIDEDDPEDLYLFVKNYCAS